MKPERGPQTMFLGQLLSLGKSRQGRQPAILEYRLLAAELGKLASRQV